MVGNPTVNINEVMVEGGGKDYDVATDTNVPAFIDGVNVVLHKHEKGKMGVIGTIFGGGNAAKVVGNTNVNVGTTAEEPFESLRRVDNTVPKKAVVGADIRGNVYGGGNNADVTGKTNVIIGKEK